MTHDFQRIQLPAPAPGTARHVGLHRFGEAGARPLVLIQAGLHGDEAGGPLVAHHLARLLAAADAARRIAGEIRLVPLANPVAAAQQLLDLPAGRHALASGEPFDRRFPDLSARLLDLAADGLGPDAQANAAAIRGFLLRALAERPAGDEAGHLRHCLLRLALPAELVLDLHCGAAEAPHLETGAHLWPGLQDLAAATGAAAVLLGEEGEGLSFAQALYLPWRRLAGRAGPDHPVPADGCLAATLHLGGGDWMDDQEAAEKAEAVYRFLCHRGLVDEPAPDLPPPACTPTPTEGVDLVRAPAAGILVWFCEVGDAVRTGELLGEIVDPMAADPAGQRTSIYSLADGCFLSRVRSGLVRPGQVLGRVAGEAALPRMPGNMPGP